MANNNFISAIWCSRLEPSDNINGKVLTETEHHPKKTQLYLNCFYPFKPSYMIYLLCFHK